MAAMASAYEQLPEDGAMNVGLKMAEQSVRNGFIRKVYGILTVQLLLTIAVAFPIVRAGTQFVATHQWLLLLSFAMTIGTICAMSCCRDMARKVPMNYILLFTFTAFEGVLVGCVAAMYTWQSVMVAVGMTAAIFFAMTLYACTTKTDFTGMGPYLVGALLASLCVCMVLSMLTACGFNLNWTIMLYDAGMALLFTMFLVYDTQMILGGNHQCAFDIDEYVFAALNIYLDIINLFLYLLQLFGDRK